MRTAPAAATAARRRRRSSAEPPTRRAALPVPRAGKPSATATSAERRRGVAGASACQSPDLPPRFSSTRIVAHHHAAVGRLAHVVDRQQADLHGGQRLHLDAGAAERLDLRGAAHARWPRASSSNSTATRVIGSGWHSGISSAVRLARLDRGDARDADARRPSWRCPTAISASVAGCMRIAPLARATRCVSALADDVDHVRLAVRRRSGSAALDRRRVCVERNKGETIPVHHSDARSGRQRPAVRPFARPCRSLAPTAPLPARRCCVAASPAPARWPWRCAAVLPPAAAQNSLPALGDSGSATTSASAPSASSATQIMREIRRDPDYLDDPLLLEYLQSIWQPLVAAGARARQHHAPTSTSASPGSRSSCATASVNAFALPGGYVGVHLGLIAITATRDELASVLGARAVARHAAPHRAQHRGQRAGARWSAWRR